MKKNISIIIFLCILGAALFLYWPKGGNMIHTIDEENSGGINQTGAKFDPSIPAGGLPKKSTTLGNIDIKTTVLDEAKMDKNPLLVNDLVANRLYLMEKSGKVLFEWPLGQQYLGNDAFLLPDGRLLASVKSKVPHIILGGYGGVTEYMGTGGEALWKYEISSTGVIAHHDAELLPNGNILTIVWHKIEKKDAKKNGYKEERDIFPERIVEINPKNNSIVWRWDSMEHDIQNVNPKAPNYGEVEKHPEKINLNYANSFSGMIMHGNGLAYDSKNDLIYMSVYNFSEVWVIDHSTSSGEVRTSKGGAYNRGGDLIYRFGNPSAYGGTGTRLFYSNHHPSFSNEGTFLIYSNGIKANPEQSTAYELKIPKELDEKKPTLTPPEVVWSYTNSDLFFDKVGGVTKAPNGNYIITEGDGKIWEVTKDKELVWTYSVKPAMFWRTYVYPYGSPELKSLGIEKSQ